MKRKKVRTICQGKRAAALLLVVILVLSPCLSLLWDNITARAEEFRIKKLKDNSIIQDGNFIFYGSRMKDDLYYWIKSDGSPLFCIQKTASLIPGLNGGETVQEFGSSQYLNEKRYELISLVLQCCGMIKGENPILDPGTYLAGQAAVWGITSVNWTDTQRFREEMEMVYRHIGDWYDVSEEEIISKSREAVDRICQAIEDYYSDNSPYVPSFASKYKEKAPVWKAEWQEDGSCEIEFGLDGKAEAVKEFIFQLPEGWTYEWQDNRIIFHGEKPQEGLISVTGKAKEGSVLEEAMPIGLVYIVGPASFSTFQRLASEVELKTAWSCYFKLLVAEQEDPGSWYLPEVNVYQHQETFNSVYGVELEKLDGETGETISGVEFQPLEYIDAQQLEGTVLDKGQIATWTGWKARCGPVITDQDGKLEHRDEHEYLYEKTYCSGHPAPEITYNGSSEKRREQLEQEAEEAWENAVQECSRRCDFHRIDKTGQDCLEEDRNLAYKQFIHLVYGYTFKEIKPAEGYLPHGEHEKDEEIERVFLTSVQAGGERQEKEEKEENKGGKQEENNEEGKKEIKLKTHYSNQARLVIIRKTASSSNAEKKLDKKEVETGSRDKEMKGGSNEEISVEVNKKEETKKETASNSNAKGEEDNTEEKVPKNEEIKKAKWRKREAVVWLTSLIEPLEQQVQDANFFYEFTVKNYKKEKPPEETTPEETTPEETTPEETTPEETTPEETTPEETMPEETTPEETTPEETTPEETTPEETTPEETTPEETTPEETTPEETTPEETTPEETTPEETTPEETTPEETTPEETTPEETTPEETTPEETTPEETTPEETTPEETTPEETTPEETTPEETTPEETTPEETTLEETTPEETTPEETTPEETLPETLPPKPSPPPGGSGRRDRGTEITSLVFPPETPPETLPFVFLTEELVPQVGSRMGWITARYATPSIAQKGKGGKKNPPALLPPTGDRGIGTVVLLLFIIGSGSISLLLVKRRKKKGNPFCFVFLLVLGWLVSSVCEVQAAGLDGEVLPEQEDARLVVYYSAEEAIQENEEGGIPETVVDETGQVYWLENCQMVQQNLEEKEEWVTEVVEYSAVEVETQIPKKIMFQKQEKDTGREGAGELMRTAELSADFYWTEDFQLPLRFYDYGAEGYKFNEMEVPGESALEYLMEHQQNFLEMVNCTPDNYRIENIIWNGNSYPFADMLCRDALVLGKKRVSDRVVEYSGKIIYPEAVQEQWEAVYAPEIFVDFQESVPLESILEETAPEESKAVEVLPPEYVFSWFKRVAAYTVSFAVLLPVFLYLILLFKKRRKMADN